MFAAEYKIDSNFRQPKNGKFVQNEKKIDFTIKNDTTGNWAFLKNNLDISVLLLDVAVRTDIDYFRFSGVLIDPVLHCRLLLSL